MEKLAFMASTFLRQRTLSFVRRHSVNPISLSYQSDATPTKTTETFIGQAGMFRVVRSGMRTGEYLLHRSFLRTADDQKTTFFGEPMRILDKTTMTHLQAARPYLFYPFKYGCRTVNITHVVFDGALFESLSLAIFRDHSKSLEIEARSMSVGEAQLLQLHSWFVGTPCMDHSCQNAVRWGLRQFLDQKELMKSVWSVIQSARTCFATLVDHLGLWIASRVVFKDWVFEHAGMMWTMLGYEPHVCEQLVRLQLRFECGSICVAEEFADDPDVVSDIYVLLLRAYKMHEWTDSRWLSIGNTSRAFVGAQLLGLPALVEFALARGHSDFFLHSFNKLDSPMGEFFVCAAVSTFPADACLVILLADDRLPIVWKELCEELRTELQYVIDLPFDVWEVLGISVGIPARRLRDQAILATMTAVGYLKQRFDLALQPPWSIFLQTPEEALREIALIPDEPSDALLQKIWLLHRLGCEEQTLLQGIKLLRNLSWSQVSTEQGHQASSCIMKRHRAGMHMMQVRSMLGQSRCLFSKSSEVLMLDKCRLQLARLQRRRPQYITGRQAYLGEIIDFSATIAGERRQAAPKFIHRLVSGHGRLWKQMSNANKDVYEQKARLLRDDVSTIVMAGISDAQVKLRAQRERAEATLRTTSGPSLMSDCRCTDREIDEFDQMWDDPRFARGRVAEERARLDEVVGPVGIIEQAVLEMIAVPSRTEALPVHPWMKMVAKFRDLFSNTIFEFRYEDGGVRHMRFLFACQKPVWLAFVLLVCETDLGEAEQAHLLHSGGETWEHSFTMVADVFAFTHQSEAELEETMSISVLGDVVFFDRYRLGSDADWRSLEVVVAQLGPMLGEKNCGPQRHNAHTPLQNFVTEHPWLLDVFGQAPARSSSRGVAVPARGHVASEGDAAEEDVDPEAVIAALAEAREQWEVEQPKGLEHFTWTIRGGLWTAAHTGLPYDSFRSQASTATGKDFLRKKGLHQSATFSLSLYGEPAAATLAKYWVARMAFLLSLDQASDGCCVYNAIDLAGFQEPDDLVQLASDAQGSVLARITQLRGLKP